MKTTKNNNIKNHENCTYATTKHEGSAINPQQTKVNRLNKKERKIMSKSKRTVREVIPKPSDFNEQEFFDSLERLSDDLQSDCIMLFNQGKSNRVAGEPKWSRDEFLNNYDELASLVGKMDILIDLEYTFYCNGYDGRFEAQMKKCICGYMIRDDVSACFECSEEIKKIIYKNDTPEMQMPTLSGLISLEDYLEDIVHNGFGPAGKCAICDGNYILGGNNPQPVIDDCDARCCVTCYSEIVTPIRLKQSRGAKTEV